MTFKKNVKKLYRMEKYATFNPNQLEHWIECLKESFYHNFIAQASLHCPCLDFNIYPYNCFETDAWANAGRPDHREYCQDVCQRAVLYRKICQDIQYAENKYEKFNYFIHKLEKLF